MAQPSEFEFDAASESSRSPSPVPQRRIRRRNHRRGNNDQNLGDGGGESLSGLGGAVKGVTGGLGNQHSGGGKNTLKLRLDLNLAVDISIKARVHGDVSLSLL
ncbi:uncharacterized protein EV420DRAFT_493138 [Desarmillaria tabescens]|uniref:Uncharacterized protein n=1 Tax=Armillaria tabescens TaxID=1929756 RepID=A0AA39N4Y3_ARMTA|nr:uncharacterized protein EV420DRAFT_493138 [Desarmillaria tabescens]KAK0457430.1 hypothetical protein EV420DRAFT_493138 [Desarmillaria tabescens]